MTLVVRCMMPVMDYKELRVWQRSIDLVSAIYTATRTFPEEEKYGLKSQLRRAAVSVPSNIAEGQGRSTTGEFQHFLGIARGSLYEIETQIHIADRLSLLQPDQMDEIKANWKEVIRMLNSLMRALPRK